MYNVMIFFFLCAPDNEIHHEIHHYYMKLLQHCSVRGLFFLKKIILAVSGHHRITNNFPLL